MVEDVNKIFGRDFVIAFFVPSLAFLFVTIAYLHVSGRPISWLKINPDDPLKGSTFIALVTLTASFCLMSVNRLVIRTLEGYWIFDLGRSIRFIQTARFRWLQSRIETLTKEAIRCKEQKITFTKRRKRNRLMLRAAQRFPSREDQILCTSFGNTFKAFEDYPRVMYGFESIQGWSRLNTILPKEFRETLSSTRSLTDFWANIWFLSLVFIAQYIVVEILFLGHTSDVRILLKAFPDAWFLYSAIVVAFVSSWQARIAAAQWGEWVKAAFDVFLPKLCTKLGYKRPLDIKAEREFWTKVSQAIVYRDPVSLEELTDLREAASDRTSKKGSNYDKQVTEKDSSKRRGFGDNLVRVARLLTWSLIFRRQK